MTVGIFFFCDPHTYVYTSDLMRVPVCVCARACLARGREGICSPSAAEKHQEPLELDLNPQSLGSSGVCSKFFRRMVFSPLPLPPPPFSLSFSAHIW